jgi:hypothetical protein
VAGQTAASTGGGGRVVVVVVVVVVGVHTGMPHSDAYSLQRGSQTPRALASAQERGQVGPLGGGGALSDAL